MRVKNNTKKENDRAKPKIEAHEFLRMNIQDPPKMDKLELFKSLAFRQHQRSKEYPLKLDRALET